MRTGQDVTAEAQWWWFSASSASEPYASSSALPPSGSVAQCHASTLARFCYFGTREFAATLDSNDQAIPHKPSCQVHPSVIAQPSDGKIPVSRTFALTIISSVHKLASNTSAHTIASVGHSLAHSIASFSWTNNASTCKRNVSSSSSGSYPTEHVGGCIDFFKPHAFQACIG